MEFSLIKQPIIKLTSIKPENFGLPADFPVTKLSSMQEWTMNTLKTIDKDMGT
jgi:hypothetical protein